MKKIIFDKYAKAVAKAFHLEMDKLFEKSKRRNQVDARQILYLLCMERPIRLTFIKSYLEEHGYTVPMSSILHGYERAKLLVDEDPDYRILVEEIKASV
jgi:chromosomal replication initiation ATPase DnaA